jgi:peptidoglycan-N-acetylglucosamine deacetylase
MSLDESKPPARYLPWWLVPGLISAAPVAALAGQTAVAHGLLHPACAAFAVSATWVNCAWFGPVVTHFATTRQEVWLTIDDGPDPEDTPRLLDLLDAAGARATFFAIGEKARRHRNLVDEIVRRGHGLGYHTRSHPAGTFWASGPRRARNEIQNALDDIGHPTSLIRPPVGMANIFVHRAVRHLDLDLIGWSIRSLDTRATSGTEVANRVDAQLAPGRIIMLHEGHRDHAGRSFHPEIVAATLGKLAVGGWQAVIPPRSAWLSRGRPLALPISVSQTPVDNC